MSGILVSVVLAQVEGLFAIVIFVIAFFSWVANLKNQNPPQPKRGPRQREVQEELDEFLNQSRRNRQRGGNVAVDQDVEVLDPPRKPQQRRPPPQGQQRTRSRREIWEEQVRKTEETQRGERGKSTTGRGTKQTGQRPGTGPQPQGNRRPASTPQAQQNLQAVVAVVPPLATSGLKEFTADAPTAFGQQGIQQTIRTRKGPAVALFALLRTPQGVRNAVLMNEILTKPRALRR